MLCQLVSHFVSLKDVLEGSDLHTILFENSQERQNFILTIAVTVDPSLTLKDFPKSFQFQITTRRQATMAGLPCVHAPTVISSSFEGITVNLLDAHSSRWITTAAVRSVALLDVFAQCEFDARRSFAGIAIAP